ncbi:MAG TPA: 30S ribosomal protein S2, partial [Alphaproteobacteria bacterium]|nr:30S ribosomal protein S2 [Alphaproteobacteria bacterium]
VDSNCDPDSVTFPIPGNDDAARALSLYCDLVADAVLDGFSQGAVDMGVDLGESENPVEPAIAAEDTAEAPAAEDAPAAEAPADDAKKSENADA